MRPDVYPRGGRTRSGIPETSYPTPNINDVMVVEDVELPGRSYAPLVPGTPRANDTNAKLVWQGPIQGDGGEVLARRIYVTERAAQDAHNYRITYSANNASYPIFTRTYLERRDSYVPRLSLTVLGSVYRLLLTAGGTGYNSSTTVSFSGGGGTGVAASLEIQGGVIVAVLLTNCGINYTSAPTVSFIGGGGSGASATAAIQTSACLLVSQQTSPAPDELAGLYVVVTRVYETLPGPVLSEPFYDPETLLAMAVMRQRVAGTENTLATPGDSILFGAAIVISEAFENESSNVRVRVTTIIASAIDGFTRTEYKSVGYQFPAIFVQLGGWAVPTASPFTTQGPFPGIDFSLKAHRTASKPAEVVYVFSNGVGVAPTNTYQVTTPGIASRIFNIGSNTIHAAIDAYEDRGGADVMQIEDIDASTPSSYTPGSQLLIQVSKERWKGPIFRATLVYVAE